MRFIPVFLVAFFVFAWPVQSAYAGTRSCYSMYEAEAEQGIRIHSELMVIGLNCQHMAKKLNLKGENLYVQYKRFTLEHEDLFSSYEKTLIQFFKESGSKNPEAALHKLRTDFANKISSDAANMRPDVFCSVYAPRIPKAARMNNNDLRRWASTFYDSHPVTQPVCEQ